MILNREQSRRAGTVENGEPVAMNVAGTACILERRDIFRRLTPELDAGPWTIEEMNLLADEAEAIISPGEPQ